MYILSYLPAEVSALLERFIYLNSGNAEGCYLCRFFRQVISRCLVRLRVQVKHFVALIDALTVDLNLLGMSQIVVNQNSRVGFSLGLPVKETLQIVSFFLA